ncbi:MAG: FAD-binding oxidoreductase [Acidimicrobiales bacterium]
MPATDPSRSRLGNRLGPLAEELAEAVGASHVVADPDVTARYRTDWTGRHGGYRALVVRPGSATEVAAVLGATAARGIAVVAQGGNTGLVGGSVPGGNDVVILSTERLDVVEDLDAVTGRVTAGAGVTLAALSEALDGSGWRYAVDLGARDSATIGGTIATNAGGMRVFRHGSTRAQVLGLEYVTADGAITTRLGGLTKDNTGYDLAGLICGSEGTLAIVTRARLRLVPDPPHRATAMLGFATRPAAFAAAWALRRSCPSVEVVEYLSRACVDVVATDAGLARPVPGAAVLLVEAAADSDPSDDLAEAIAALPEAPDDVAVAASATQRAAMWRLRDDLTTTLARRGRVLKLDVSIPSDRVGDVVADAEALVAALAPGAACWWFGHVCDDNLHLNLTELPGPGEAVDELEDRLLALVAAHGGSISAEHGIGRTKARQLHRARSAAEIAQMRAVKAALDPDGLLNPGVILR